MKKSDIRLVYTSDPEEAKRLREAARPLETVDRPPAGQTIRVAIDRKRRGGKTVTVASGFALRGETLQELSRDLKKRCGSGGTAKENEIEIQGDHVTTVKSLLQERGYRVK
jgi:translation initiation factor 1